MEAEERRGTLEVPRRFERLRYRALTEGLVSLAKAAQLLQRPADRVDADVRGPAA